MLNLEVRKRAGGAELHRVLGAAITVGASSGNEVVIRARGVAGRHVRFVEKDGRYQLDLYKGVDAITVNGREFSGGPIAAGDRITIGEATITVVQVGSSAARPAPAREIPISDTFAPSEASTAPSTEIEYRALRLSVYRLCRQHDTPEEIAIALTDFLDQEFAPREWAVGHVSPASGFRFLASTFVDQPALPPSLLEEVRGGDRVVRSESVAGVLTLVVENAPSDDAFAILVRESPRLPARTILFLEEAAQLAGIAIRRSERGPVAAPAPVVVEPEDQGEIDVILRQTDDLKKIVETVEREVIDRAMRRVQGNQSRGAEVLNISRGSLIAKLKEYRVPDYRYLRRDRHKRT